MQPDTEKSRVLPSTERHEDLWLSRLIANADKAAFAELYRTYEPRLARFLGRLIHHPHLVEEVLDDTLMVVWQRAGDFQGKSKLSTWIFAIAYRKAMKAVQRWDVPVEDTGAPERVSEEQGPEEVHGRNRLHALLRAAMANLSPDHQVVVELTYFHDLGYREIAEIMECPVDTVKTRMFYARRHLKKCLEGELGDWI